MKKELETLRYMMQENIVKFSYEKSDGSIREAYGTLNSQCIDDYKPAASTKGKRAPREVPSTMFLYFDIEKLNWRMFCRDRFIGIDFDYE